MDNTTVKSVLHTYRYLLARTDDFCAKTMLSAVMVLDDVDDEAIKIKSELITIIAQSKRALGHMRESDVIDKLGIRWEADLYTAAFAEHIVKTRDSLLFKRLGSTALLDTMKLAYRNGGNTYFQPVVIAALGIKDIPLSVSGKKIVNAFWMNLDKLPVGERADIVRHYLKRNGRYGFQADFINKFVSVGLHKNEDLWNSLGFSSKHMHTALYREIRNNHILINDEAIEAYLVANGTKGYDDLKDGSNRETIERVKAIYNRIHKVGNVEIVRDALNRSNLSKLHTYHNDEQVIASLRDAFKLWADFDVVVTTIDDDGKVTYRSKKYRNLADFEKDVGSLESVLAEINKREIKPGTSFISRLVVNYKAKKINHKCDEIFTNYMAKGAIVNITPDEIINRLRYEYGGEKKPRKRHTETAPSLNM